MTALMIGRYQPWHAGHRALYDEAVARHGHVTIGVRDTYPGPKDPLTFTEVRARIWADVPDATVILLPNVTAVVYGRDVGYQVERIELPADIEAISATAIRAAEVWQNPESQPSAKRVANSA
jgi:hypothetical protein